MSNMMMTKWQCIGCGNGGEEPCTTYGMNAPHACPYGIEKNMLWETVEAPQNTEEGPKTQQVNYENCPKCNGHGCEMDNLGYYDYWLYKCKNCGREVKY